jgi:hypothetical protein
MRLIAPRTVRSCSRRKEADTRSAMIAAPEGNTAQEGGPTTLHASVPSAAASLHGDGVATSTITHRRRESTPRASKVASTMKVVQARTAHPCQSVMRMAACTRGTDLTNCERRWPSERFELTFARGTRSNNAKHHHQGPSITLDGRASFTLQTVQIARRTDQVFTFIQRVKVCKFRRWSSLARLD